MEQSERNQHGGAALRPPPPAERLRPLIRQHRRNPLLLATPAGAVLPLLDQYVADVERRLGVLAGVQLRVLDALGGGASLHPAQVEALRDMVNEAQLSAMAKPLEGGR